MQQTQQLQKIAEGREAEIFAWEDGAVLKLYRDAEYERRMEIEEAAMMAAQAAHAPAPAARGRTQIDGRPGLIIERVDGVDLLTAIDRKPWVVFRAGGVMARSHAALHETRAPDTLPDLKERMREMMRRSPLVPAGIREFAVAALERLPDGERLCHGDFHPGNIIMGKEGPVVIDWPNSVRGDPHADVARSLMMFRLGELPEGASPVIRTLAGIGRRIILSRYLGEYRKLRQLDMSLLARWEVPVAAHRLSEGIEPERAKLIALVEAHMASAS